MPKLNLYEMYNTYKVTFKFPAEIHNQVWVGQATSEEQAVMLAGIVWGIKESKDFPFTIEKIHLGSEYV